MGNNLLEMWTNLKDGKIGISYINHFNTDRFDVKIAGMVKNFDISNFIKKNVVKNLDLFIQYGLAAGIQAIEDSGIYKYKNLNRSSVGVIFGSGIGGLEIIEQNIRFVNEGKKLKPSFIPGCIINTIAGYLSKIYKFTGPSLAVSTACATGGHVICMADNLIKSNKAKIIIAGGAEKASTPLALAGFSSMKALSKNKNPFQASRPWDLARDGFVISDGSACLVLEEYEHAMNRNANVYAELIASEINNDAYHMIAPDPNGVGIYNCMNNVLKSAMLDITNIDYINAHATSTILGDISESIAISQLLNGKKNIPINSVKSMMGHMLGASGSIEAIITILSIKEQLVLANINLDNIDKKCLGLNFVSKNIKMNINYAISNCFGFGGMNSSIVLKKI